MIGFCDAGNVVTCLLHMAVGVAAHTHGGPTVGVLDEGRHPVGPRA